MSLKDIFLQNFSPFWCLDQKSLHEHTWKGNFCGSQSVRSRWKCVPDALGRPYGIFLTSLIKNHGKWLLNSVFVGWKYASNAICCIFLEALWPAAKAFSRFLKIWVLFTHLEKRWKILETVITSYDTRVLGQAHHYFSLIIDLKTFPNQLGTLP